MGSRIPGILLFLTAPLWLPLRLVLDMAGLCADGLFTMLSRGGRTVAPPGPAARLLLGIPALVVFPLWVTLETLYQGLAGLARSGGRIGATVVVTALAVTPFVLDVRWLDSAYSGPRTGALVHLGVLAGGLLILLMTGLARGIRGRSAKPSRTRTLVAAPFEISAALLAVLTAPVWLPALALVWMGRQLLLSLVIRPLGERLSKRRKAEVLFVLNLGLLLGLAWCVALILRHLAKIPGIASAPQPWVLSLVLALLLFPALLFLMGGSIKSVTRFESLVALRYLRGKRDASFVSAITLISTLGVALGVCSLNVVLGVMSGFEEDLRSKILGARSHVMVHNYERTFDDYDNVLRRIGQVPGVTGATPFVGTELMVKSTAGVSGAVLKGIHAETVGTATDLPRTIRTGPDGDVGDAEAGQALLDTLDQPVDFDPVHHLREEDAALPGIILGSELADSLRVDEGHRVFVVSPKPTPGPLGTLNAAVKPFRVAGIFYSGMYEYDATFAFISLKAAQELLGLDDQVETVEVRVDDIYAADDIARAIRAELKYPFWTRDWMAQNASLFSALKLEKIAMAIILTFIIVVAAMNIISALIMVVLEKGREIAIFKTMGAAPLRIMKVFMIEGLVIGFIGTTLGTGLGYVLCWLLDKYRFIPLETDVYYLDRLPVAISWPTFAVVALTAVGISFAATLFPSWQAAELDPVEGLRYE